MNPSYLELCQATKSDQFHGDKLTKDELLQTIGAAITALNVLDAVKKTLFYGREFPNHRHTIAENARSVASGWTYNERSLGEGNTEVVTTRVFSEQKAIDVIHAILGSATEAGEMLELLNKAIRTKDFDPVNYAEEIFDDQWYHSIGCKAIGTTFEQGQATNIAKLKLRFGDKFDAWYANNRNLVAERQALEGNSVLVGTDAKDGELLKDYAKRTNQNDAFRIDPIG